VTAGESFVRPAHLWVPEDRAGSLLDEVSDVADLVRRPLDGSQRIAVDCLTSYRPGGLWCSLEAVILMARQNGKTGGVMTMIVLDDLFNGPPDRIVWTAHLFKTARAAFEDIRDLIDGCDELRRRVRKVREANGEEGIELTNGAALDFLARSKGGGRGLGGKRVVIDEALFAQLVAMGALLPVLAARPNPQVLVGSSAAVAESDYLRALVQRGRAGGPSAPAFVEFCAPGSLAEPGCEQLRCDHRPGTAGCALDDLDKLRLANPGWPAGRVQLRTLQQFRSALPPEEYAREFFGWHDAPDEHTNPITVDQLLRAVDKKSKATGRRRLAIDVAPDRRSAAVAGAGRREDGALHVAVARTGSGVEWIVPEVVGIAQRQPVDAVVVDGASPAAAFVPELTEALRPLGVAVEVLGARDMAAACGLLQDALAADPTGLKHRGDEILTAALAGARRRDIGDGGWGWARKRSDADITPLVAFTLAHYAVAANPDTDYDLLDSIG
jgi:hypothetical protein